MNKKYDFLIDTHCHLDFDDYVLDIDAVVKNALNANVRYLITISTKFKLFHKIENLVSRFDNVYCSVGTHPLYIDDEYATYTPSDLLDACNNSKVVAIGECGLDYSRLKHDNKKEQESMFRLQIECSNVSGLPFIIHNRNSDEDMERILIDEAKKNKLRGLTYDQILEYLKSAKKEDRLKKYKALLKFKNIPFEADLFTWHNDEL